MLCTVDDPEQLLLLSLSRFLVKDSELSVPELLLTDDKLALKSGTDIG
jgi:hypothetical protein